MPTAARYAAAVVLVIAAAARAAAPAAPPDAQAIKPNTWTNAALRYVLPADVPGAGWSTSDGYCGSAYRSKTGTVLFRSGVDSKAAGLSPGFYSNAFLEWAPATGEAKVIDVANWGGGSYGGGKLLEAFATRPTPSPRHIYDGIAYVESQDAVYLMLGANWRIGEKATDDAKQQLNIDNKSTWKYTFADGRWKRIDSSIRDFWPGGDVSPYESHMRYWPEGGKLLFVDDGGGHYAEFDLKTEKWEKVALKNKATVPLYNARSTWDSKRQLWVFRLGPKLGALNPRTKEFQAIPDAYDMPSGEKNENRAAKGVCYIPRHDVYLIAGATGNDTYVFDVEKAQWRNVRGGDIALVNGYLQYDPKTDLVGMVYQHKAFRFRYVPDKAGSAGTKPDAR